MALFQVNIELNRVAKALERIAEAIERAYPPERNVDRKPASVDNLTVFDPEAECLREDEEERQRQRGILPGSRRRI